MQIFKGDMQQLFAALQDMIKTCDGRKRGGACLSSLGKLKKENQKSNIILGYRASLKIVWAT